MENILKQNMDGTVRKYFELLVCSAYMELGNYDAAKKIINGICEFPDNKGGLFAKLEYSKTLFNYYAYTNDLSKAEETINTINTVLTLLNNDALISEELHRSMPKEYLNSLNLRKGNYDGLEEYYTDEFEDAKSMFKKVNVKLKLGKIYLHDKRDEEAKEAFEFVVTHGNKLHKVQEAKEYLKQMSSDAISG